MTIKNFIKWQPILGQHYFYLDDSGIIRCVKWDYDDADTFRYNVGNCFKTEQEAEDYKENKESYGNKLAMMQNRYEKLLGFDISELEELSLEEKQIIDKATIKSLLKENRRLQQSNCDIRKSRKASDKAMIEYAQKVVRLKLIINEQRLKIRKLKEELKKK